MRAHRLSAQGASGQAGLTLVELMISMALGLLVVAAATGLLLSAKAGYTMQDDDGLIQDSGRYALETVARAVRQAGYENWDASEAPVLVDAAAAPSIIGLDAARLASTSPGIASPLPDPVNGSDVLAVRFFGASDGTMLNCAGFDVPAPAPAASADASRGWSIFYVARDSSGMPQLYCKYQGSSAWSAQAIVQGVESFQVLYGLDSDGDSLPNRFLNAAAIDALDAALVLEGATPQQQAIDKSRKTNWKKVTVVKVALLVRGNHNTRVDASDAEYDLFGSDYAEANAVSDAGVRVEEADMPPAERKRLRKTFAATIQLRNQASGSAT